MIRRLIALIAATLSLSAFAAVDVNQATRADLETVKGIGPALSAKILDARGSGSFRSWSDFVDRVGGVGPGNAARFSQAGLTVGGATFDGAPAATTTGSKKARSTDGAAPTPSARKTAAERAATDKPAADKPAPRTAPAARPAN